MTLNDLRNQIDAVDGELLRLLNERADLVHGVGEIKHAQGLEIYAPEREEKLLQSLVAKSQGRLSEKSIRAIYREIMSAALALEQNLSIAYLGPEGTWTHQAALSKFGNSVGYAPEATAREVFEKVADRSADYGVLPLETATEGAAHHILDLFAESPLKICAQIPLPVEICLMAKNGLESARQVIAHPGVAAESRRWLDSQCPPHVELIEAASSDKAATLAAADATIAALGTPLTAQLHGLNILQRNIEDEASVARFVVVGRQACPRTGDDRTAIMVSDKVDAQAMIETLGILSRLQIDVGQIGTRMTDDGSAPSADRRCAFFFEVAGHLSDPAIETAVAELEARGKSVTVLGSYPAVWKPDASA
jgi:chorismate mutase/prephenate dehydratase